MRRPYGAGEPLHAGRATLVEFIHSIAMLLSLRSHRKMTRGVRGERRERVAKACYAAGVQVVTEGKIDPAFMDAVSNAEISQEKFKALANTYWKTMVGKGSYQKAAPKLEYSMAVA